MRSTKKEAFTLVELLVVVAIIALLLAILLPALNKARGAAIAASCLSRLHQLAIMNHMYATDNGGVIPQGSDGGGTWPDGSAYGAPAIYWFSKYDDYSNDLVSDRKFACPNNKQNSVSTYAGYTTRPANYLPGEFTTKPYPDISLKLIQLNQLEQPANYALLMDSGCKNGTLYAGSGMLDARPLGGQIFHTFIHANLGGGTSGVWLAHDGAANGTFADGHAERCDPQRLASTANHTRPQAGPVPPGITAYWDTDGIPHD